MIRRDEEFLRDPTKGWSQTLGDAQLCRSIHAGEPLRSYVLRVYTLGPPYRWTIEEWQGADKKHVGSGVSRKLLLAKKDAAKAFAEYHSPAAEASESAPRPILVGSTWRTKRNKPVRVVDSDDDLIEYWAGADTCTSTMRASRFRTHFTHVSDPAPSEVAPATGSGA